MDVIIMDIPDIKGESQLDGFQDKIELLSYSHGVAMQVTGDVSNTERTSGRPNHQDVTVTKYLDRASPTLNQSCCEGKVLKTITVTVGRNDAGKIIPLIVYALENSILSSVSVGGGNGDKPVETITINYSKITWTYNPQKEEGGKEGEVKGVWDVSANKAA